MRLILPRSDRTSERVSDQRKTLRLCNGRLHEADFKTLPAFILDLQKVPFYQGELSSQAPRWLRSIRRGSRGIQAISRFRSDDRDGTLFQKLMAALSESPITSRRRARVVCVS